MSGERSKERSTSPKCRPTTCTTSRSSSTVGDETTAKAGRETRASTTGSVSGENVSKRCESKSRTMRKDSECGPEPSTNTLNKATSVAELESRTVKEKVKESNDYVMGETSTNACASGSKASGPTCKNDPSIYKEREYYDGEKKSNSVTEMLQSLTRSMSFVTERLERLEGREEERCRTRSRDRSSSRRRDEGRSRKRSRSHETERSTRSSLEKELKRQKRAGSGSGSKERPRNEERLRYQSEVDSEDELQML